MKKETYTTIEEGNVKFLGNKKGNGAYPIQISRFNGGFYMQIEEAKSLYNDLRVVLMEMGELN
jgi:hypothetical protein